MKSPGKSVTILENLLKQLKCKAFVNRFSLDRRPTTLWILMYFLFRPKTTNSTQTHCIWIPIEQQHEHTKFQNTRSRTHLTLDECNHFIDSLFKNISYL